MKVNQDHWNSFMDFADMHPELITNKFCGAAGRARAASLWEKVTNQLNGLGYGMKTVEQWRKAITDWKCKVKAKAANIHSSQGKTGGGTSNCPPLSNAESRLLNVMGKKGFEGDNVPELGVYQIESLEAASHEPLPSTSHHTQTGEKRDCSMLDVKNTNKVFPCEEMLESTPSTSTSNILQEHEYSKKGTPISRKRRRLNPDVCSDKLLQLNMESVQLLRDMNSTLTRLTEGVLSIAKSMEVLANKKT